MILWMSSTRHWREVRSQKTEDRNQKSEINVINLYLNENLASLVVQGF